MSWSCFAISLAWRWVTTGSAPSPTTTSSLSGPLRRRGHRHAPREARSSRARDRPESLRGDTVSTHALMRAGVLQLSRWGVLDGIKGRHATIRSTYFALATGQGAIKRRTMLMASTRLGAPVAGCLSTRRSAGAEFALAHLVDPSARTAAASRHPPQGCSRAGAPGVAELVIQTDGMRPPSLGSSRGCYRTGRHATGVVFAYWSGTELDGYHWCYAPGVSAGAIATNDELASLPRFPRAVPRNDAAGRTPATGKS
jgi:hypothetical protein